jgi:hypothetical protein
LRPDSDNGNLSGNESRPNSERNIPVLSGTEVRGASPVPVGRYQADKTLMALVQVIFETVSSWILGLRMRRKIRRDLERKATEADLTSIDTWIKVDEADRENPRNSPLKPE